MAKLSAAWWGDSTTARALQRRNHVRNGVGEVDAAVEVGLPVLGEDAQVVLPAAFIEAFANRVGNVSGRRRSGRSGAGGISAGRGREQRSAARGQRANHLAGSVEKQGVPEIARNGFVALAAFAKNGILHDIGDAVGSLMEEDLECFGALVASVGSGDRHANRILGCICAGRTSEPGDVNANPLSGPRRLIDFSEAVGKVETAAADERSDGGNPAAVRPIVFGPKMSAIDGRGRLQGLRKLGRQAGIAALLLGAGQI